MSQNLSIETLPRLSQNSLRSQCFIFIAQFDFETSDYEQSPPYRSTIKTHPRVATEQKPTLSPKLLRA